MQLHHQVDAIRATGAEMHVISNGAPRYIAGFRETTGYDGPLYTDPSLEVYRAAGLRRGLRTVLQRGVISRTIGALRRGVRQGRTQGSALQQGGVLVISRDGEIVWHHISAGPGDHATAPQILRAARAVGERPRSDRGTGP